MDPEQPASAHRIVREYISVLERDAERALPSSVGALPYPKQTIKTAILTCTSELRSRGELTSEMLGFLEQAYVALADYVGDDLVRVMAEYRDALDAVASTQSRDRNRNPAWQRITDTSRLAGDVARSIADDSAALRLEFQAST